ncbi:MAG: cytochrome c biogenesis protein CcdA [bacterium]|nr:cytochrome c biogenesis protein CcdA [bacterium]
MEIKNTKIKIWVAIAAVFLGVILLFRFSEGGAEYLWQASRGGQWLLPLVAVAALLDSINPCAFSILLLTIAFLFSLGQQHSKVLLIGGFYIAGLFVVYVLIGLGILQVLHLFNAPHFMANVGAVLLVTLGVISLINEFFPRFPIKLRLPNFAHHKMAELMEKSSLPAAFALGGLVGLCEFPCTGGPYLMVLGLLHDSGTYMRGLVYLLLYNLIFILPLVLILFLSTNVQLVEKVKSWQRRERRLMKIGGGVAMIILGIIIFFF